MTTATAQRQRYLAGPTVVVTGQRRHRPGNGLGRRRRV